MRFLPWTIRSAMSLLLLIGKKNLPQQLHPWL
jgi:hypothetical protein